MLLALCALGAVWDLLHARPVAAPAAESLARPAPAAAGAVARGAPNAAGDPVRAAGPLDLNLATAAQLDALPGIGPVLAARILEHRRLASGFRSVDELLAVRGIGPSAFARLRPLVSVTSAPSSPAGDTMQIAITPRR